jgi:putative glycosyltransferase
MKLSVVATLYQSEPYVGEFCSRVSDAARSLAGDAFEIILVNDGSPDRSLQVALSVQQLNPHVVIVDLSRNFGHHRAMMTGMAHARGEQIFLIDSDLEELPEWLLEFDAELRRTRSDVVYGVQRQRKGDRFEQLTGSWFYQMFRAVTGIQLPENVVTARLMTRRYVNALLLHDEREFFIAGLWHITGFLNAPLIAIFYVGVSILLFALLYIATMVGLWMTSNKPISGYTSLIASIWLLGGLMISFMGVLGIYLAKIFSEAKRRPYTIVRDIFRKS